jgi:hypothetical protein
MATSTKVDAAVQAAMKKPRGKRTEKERALVRAGRLLQDMSKFEQKIGRLEDKLGLPRSKASEPWNDRVQRIHKRQAKLA